MTRAGRGLLIAALAGLLAAGAIPAGALREAAATEEKKEEEKPKKSVDPGAVYFGDAKKWDKPAEVDADKVYGKIDEYKQIVEQGLKPGDAKYEILMTKASTKFTCAVKKAAKDGSYDLVARLGSVKGVESVPNITDDVIAKL